MKQDPDDRNELKASATYLGQAKHIYVKKSNQDIFSYPRSNVYTHKL